MIASSCLKCCNIPFLNKLLCLPLVRNGSKGVLWFVCLFLLKYSSSFSIAKIYFDIIPNYTLQFLFQCFFESVTHMHMVFICRIRTSFSLIIFLIKVSETSFPILLAKKENSRFNGFTLLLHNFGSISDKML